MRMPAVRLFCHNHLCEVALIRLIGPVGNFRNFIRPSLGLFTFVTDACNASALYGTRVLWLTKPDIWVRLEEALSDWFTCVKKTIFPSRVKIQNIISLVPCTHGLKQWLTIELEPANFLVHYLVSETTSFYYINLSIANVLWAVSWFLVPKSTGEKRRQQHSPPKASIATKASEQKVSVIYLLMQIKLVVVMPKIVLK